MIIKENTTKRNTIYKGRVLEYVVDTVELENGLEAEREMVFHPGGVGVIAIDSEGYVYLVRQFRKPYDTDILEIPAGKLDKNETPEACGRRELEEETGLLAKKLISLGEIYPSVGYTNEIIRIFLATEFECGKSSPDEDEFVDVVKIPFAELVKMVMNGEIKDAKTVVAALKAKALISNN
ncbi:MAG: NUDIX hydrolase [Clostridia bacterium]|nr:NUDIX hydrolase [Clostridia bacterium]